MKRGSASTWNVFADGANTNTTVTVTGLTDDTEYNFRVKGYNGSYGPYSNIETERTAPNVAFFDPNLIAAFNLGGATDSTVVALEAGAVITLTNATYPTGTTLTTLTNAGDTYRFTSALNDQLSSDKQFFVAGRKGSGSITQRRAALCGIHRPGRGPVLTFQGRRMPLTWSPFMPLLTPP
ncbi:MAG: fibronectin type III domain-containing protein [Bdellovibrionales bacterium]